ncbi:hypothetical protein SRABI118_00621 [Massilia sp. Bi118]|uniref:hypothetical protein n=1 Tax=Massilia sp. Bi118 TaxID=2822346 RepID=UPI001D9D6E95|nr:hypothetical protein [Massilia sp. Bi118]CAH0155410.1 hypothetical protein SRABI118_00621 [Massilia sp. Bi118]
MNVLYRHLLLCLPITLATPAASAQASGEDEPTRALQFSCVYRDAKGAETESATIGNDLRETQAPGQAARIAVLQRTRSGQQAERMTVRAGELAECRFPSGRRVRVKVGEETGNPYGMCGADPEVFMSVWVDGKKLESRRWFAGHCYRDDPGNPDLHLRFEFTGAHSLAQRCETRASAAGLRKTACTGYPELTRLAPDTREYPPEGVRPARAGEVELLSGTGQVCTAVLAALRQDFALFSNGLQPGSPLTAPAWSDPDGPDEARLPKQLRNGDYGIFDLDNDGKPERVLRKEFDDNYMAGNLLLARYGSRAAPAWDPAGEDRGMTLLPCRIGAPSAALRRCVPFAQNGEAEGDFSADAGPGQEAVTFRGRYLRLEPFFFQGRTWLGVAGIGQRHHAAVLEPRPSGAFRQACLFRQVQENF